MSPSSAGTKAFKARSDEWKAQQRARKSRQARQKAARDALAYDGAPGRMTAADVAAYHRQLKADCLRRMSERQTA